MKMHKEIKGAAALVRLEGRLDIHTTPEAEEFLNAIVEKDRTRIVIDMSGVPFISSYGIGILMSTSKALRERGGWLRLAALSAETKVPFEITGLLPHFDIYDSVEQALTRG